MMQNKIVFREIEVDSALINMSLTKQGLIDAIMYGASERALCTKNDPLGFDSHILYARTARGLREVYCRDASGWVKDNTNNQAAIINPEMQLRIVPCNFDEFAGNRIIDPTNRTVKGEVSKKKAYINNGTAWLPGIPDIDYKSDDGWQTWILGMHVNDEGKIGAELSLPVGFDGGYYTAFAQRIILLSGTDDVIVIGRKDYTPDDAVEVVDIDIKRK